MHSMGLHSALAIKRQRKRRDEQRRAKERRFSQQSNESGLGESNSSFVSPRSSVRGRHRRHQSSSAPDALVESKMMSSVGMLHIGVVFLVVGGFLLGSGLLPEDLTSWSQLNTMDWWNELTISGGCAIMLGVFLIVLNRYMAKREEDDLTEYVQRQLTRSRSGHRLVRDVETGALTNKHTALARAAGAHSAPGRAPADSDVFTEATDRDRDSRDSAVDGSLSPLQSPVVRSPPAAGQHLHCDLEQILEEDGTSDRADLMAPSPASAFSPANGVSPGSGPETPSETRELLHHHHHHGGSGHGHHGGSGHGHHGGSGHGHHGGSGHGHHGGSAHGQHGGSLRGQHDHDQAMPYGHHHMVAI